VRLLVKPLEYSEKQQPKQRALVKVSLPQKRPEEQLLSEGDDTPKSKKIDLYGVSELDDKVQLIPTKNEAVEYEIAQINDVTARFVRSDFLNFLWKHYSSILAERKLETFQEKVEKDA